jgi:hypothetical protein
MRIQRRKRVDCNPIIIVILCAHHKKTAHPSHRMRSEAVNNSTGQSMAGKRGDEGEQAFQESPRG